MQKRICMQATGLEELKSTSESVLVEISHPLIKVTVTVKDWAIGFLYAKMSFLTQYNLSRKLQRNKDLYYSGSVQSLHPSFRLEIQDMEIQPSFTT